MKLNQHRPWRTGHHPTVGVHFFQHHTTSAKRARSLSRGEFDTKGLAGVPALVILAKLQLAALLCEAHMKL